MTKTNLLREVGLTNIWAEQAQDRQYMIRPKKLSPKTGFYGTGKWMWEAVELPNYKDPSDDTTYHLYSLGQVPLWLFGIDTITHSKWYSVADYSNTNGTIVQITLDNGTIVPPSITYLYQTRTGAILLAIARANVSYGRQYKPDGYGNTVWGWYKIDDHDITVRFYTNAVRQSPTWKKAHTDMGDKSVSIMSRRFTEVGDYTGFVRNTEKAAVAYDKEGTGIWYIDGLISSKPYAWNADVKGNLGTVLFDQTVISISHHDVRLLPTFKSKLDNRNKYLVVGDVGTNRIDYVNDIEFYLIQKWWPRGNFVGISLSQFKTGTIRQVTSNAWSIDADYISALRNQHKFLDKFNTMSIMVVVREGGMRHAVDDQSNRLLDLNRLPYNSVVSAMSEVNSNVPFWRASELEASAYSQLMSTVNKEDVTLDLVTDAYGYSGATNKIHKMIYKVNNNRVVLDKAFTLSENIYNPNGDPSLSERTFFWYDEDGALLGYTSDNSILTNVTVPYIYRDRAFTVEVFLGKLTDSFRNNGIYRGDLKVYDNYYGFYGYRAYVSSIVDGASDEKWADVTGSKYCDYIVPDDGSMPYIQWHKELLDNDGFTPLTKIARCVNLYKVEFNDNVNYGVKTLSLLTMQNQQLMGIGPKPGIVDVFMDGLSLIEGIDYYLDGSRLTVVKASENNTSEVMVRWYGYCNPETNDTFTTLETGFIKDGILSKNDRFNVHGNRAIRCIVGGRLKRRDQVLFAEDVTSDYSQDRLRLRDGRPYAVTNYQPLVEPYTNKATAEFQAEGIKIDQVVSDYLTPRLPEPKQVSPYIDTKLWTLYSPVITYIAQLMVKGVLMDDQLVQLDNDRKIFDMFDPIIKDALPVDPCVRGYDSDYSVVLPLSFDDSLSLNNLQFNTLSKINRLYLGNKVALNYSIKILEK